MNKEDLRDMLAGMALQGMLACPYGFKDLPKLAYNYADAMMLEREKKKNV